MTLVGGQGGRKGRRGGGKEHAKKKIMTVCATFFYGFPNKVKLHSSSDNGIY